jgi:TIR domain
MIERAQLERLSEWLWTASGDRLAEELILPSHPARAWLDATHAPRERLTELLTVLANGGHLTLLAALVLRAQSAAAAPLPRECELALADALARWDAELHRARSPQYEPADVFVCYAHEDAARVGILTRALRHRGVSVFRDTDDIPPGASIAASIQAAIAACPAALVVVSGASMASSWVTREVAQLMAARAGGARQLYPIVIDDIPLPAWIADLFAIDLRGLGDATPEELIADRLRPVINLLQRG